MTSGSSSHPVLLLGERVPEVVAIELRGSVDIANPTLDLVRGGNRHTGKPLDGTTWGPMRSRYHHLITDENRKWWTLGAMCFALFMIMLDNTVVNVALPSIQRDLGASISGLEWTINGYTLSFAVLLATGGRLGDIFGRRRMFLLGVVIFALSSATAGLRARLDRPRRSAASSRASARR